MRGFWKRLLAVLLIVVGTALLYGGAILLRLDGSSWYVLGGSAVLATGIGLWRGNPRVAPIYGLFLAATLAWSLWEVGLDGWALAPRLIGPAVVGLLLVPMFQGAAAKRWLLAPAGASLGAVALAGIIAVAPAWFSPPPLTAPLAGSKAPAEWRHWGQSEGGRRYGEAGQIHTGNVKGLELAWRFDSDVAPQPYVSFEATPLMADGRLYTCLQPGVIVALDPDSGRQLWRYVSPAYARADFVPIFGGKCRGVSYYEAPRPLAQCSRRVLFATPDGKLMAVDAADGRPCRDFGAQGAADLREGMGLKDDAILAMPSSPPAIVGGLAVIGQTVSDLGSFDAPSGVIRAYDAETGELRWAWDAGRPGQSRLLPGETYTADTPNAWGVLSADPALGLVFVPTGNSLPDYYGGQRSATLEKYATSVVALDVATGQPRWHFQTVHHDLWDYDVASQPVPVDLPGANGASRAALIVPTKLGQIFVLDRATGEPIDPVEERPVPQGGVPGERTAPTQPFTTGFPSLSGPDLAERDSWGLTPLDQLWCRIRFRQARYRGQFTPVGTSDTLMYPGTAGGINWGSVTLDPARGLMVVNTLRFANFGKLIPRKDAPKDGYGGAEGWAIFEQAGTPYAFAQAPFLSPLGVPCQRPPFGTIHAFDLASRKEVWGKPFGTAAESGPFGVPVKLPIPMGVPNMGGSVATAGGLVFIAAAQDRRLRALDIATGRELWSASLPAVGAASPMTYVSPRTGRQYVVVAAGGHYGIPGPAASAILAYALPGQ